MKVTASLLPKQIHFENPSDMSDEDLNARINALAEALDLEIPQRLTTLVPSRTRSAH